MGWLKNTLVSALFLSTLLVPRIARAGAISGRIFDSHDNQTSDSTLVDVIINNGSSGTATSKVPEWGDYGLWIVSSGIFVPEPGIGDTVKMSGSLDVNGTTYTTRMRDTLMVAGSPHNGILPTAFLDDPDKPVRAHALGSWVVDDTSGISDTLRAEGWLAKNPDQKIPYINYYLRDSVGLDSTKVDTSDIYPQVAINLEKQDSLWQPGDLAIIRLYKTFGLSQDTIAESIDTVALDTLQHGCATLLDSIVFPDTVYYTGVSISEPVEKLKQFKVWPTLVRDEINISGAKSVVDIYNVSGRKVAEYNNKNSNCTGTYDFNVPQGVYFVKPRGSNSKETKKVIKLK